MNHTGEGMSPLFHSIPLNEASIPFEMCKVSVYVHFFATLKLVMHGDSNVCMNVITSNFSGQ